VRNTPAKISPVPNQPKTPMRSLRVDDSLWGQVTEIAREQGRSVTAVAIDALKRYVAWYRRQQRAASRREGNG
jgi:predicted transcriptional regulator